MGPTQPSVQWLLGVFCSDLKVLRLEADRVLHLVPRLRKLEAIIPLSLCRKGVVCN